jgi:putative transposase
MMQSVGRRYVKRFNNIHQRTGTLWEGRYKASLVSSDEYLLTCYRYIELNPVRAGIVRKPHDYRWSSYRHNALGIFDSLIVEHKTYLSLATEGQARHGKYRNLFTSEIDEDTLSDIRSCANGDLVFGSESFKDRMELALGRKTRIGKAGRPRKRPNGSLTPIS